MYNYNYNQYYQQYHSYYAQWGYDQNTGSYSYSYPQYGYTQSTMQVGQHRNTRELERWHGNILSSALRVTECRELEGTHRNH